MPRAGKGQSKGGYGRLTKAKRGTNDAKLAARRDQRAAAAAKAEARARRLAAQQAAAAATSPAPRSDHNRASPVTAPTYEPSRGELASHKRVAIIYKYELLDCPPESEWGKHGGTLRQIADHLDMPDPCDYRPIRETLLRHLGEDDVMKTRGGQGRKPILPHGQQLIAADCLQRGTGQEQAAHILTAWREGKGETALTRKPVRTAIKKLDGVRMRRGTTCTGSRDPDSAWATSRAAQSEQWRAEIETPEETAAACEPGPTMLVAHGNGTKRVKTLAKDPLSLLGQGHVIRPLGSTWPGQSKADKKLRWDCKLCGYVADFSYVNKDQEAAYIIECQGHYYPMRVDDVIKLLPPALRPADGGPSVHGRIPLEAVSWWDEKHKQLSLGSYPSKHEYRFPVNARGEHQRQENGGKLPARQPRVKAKYTGDGGRYGFGVMMKRNAEGELAGYKMQPFNYSESWLCGPKKYWARETAELARVADFTASGWGAEGGGARRLRGDGGAAWRALPASLPRHVARGAEACLLEDPRRQGRAHAQGLRLRDRPDGPRRRRVEAALRGHQVCGQLHHLPQRAQAVVGARGAGAPAEAARHRPGAPALHPGRHERRRRQALPQQARG